MKNREINLLKKQYLKKSDSNFLDLRISDIKIQEAQKGPTKIDLPRKHTRQIVLK